MSKDRRSRSDIPPDPGTITGTSIGTPAEPPAPATPDNSATKAPSPPAATQAGFGASPDHFGPESPDLPPSPPASPTPVPTPAATPPIDPATATVVPPSPPSASAQSASPATSAVIGALESNVSNRSRERSQGWGTLRLDDQLEPGKVVFDRYQVVRKLGAGGMGSVWLVRHLTLDTERALKIIVSKIADDARARGRFRREAQAMARFTHANAVVVHDAVLTRDVAFIEMEFVEGLSLDKVFKRGHPFPVERVAGILRQLCAVLEVAHSRGIVHRDLKPSNLMLVGQPVSSDDSLKVLDFGIAKIIGQGDEVHTLPNEFLGTPPYTSPEQARGFSDARSDIYSVGVILFELLTGYRPFRGPVAQQISDTINTPPPPFRVANPEVNLPAGLEQLVHRCMAKQPEDRPQTIRAVWEEFQAALPEGTVARIGTLPPPPRPAARVVMLPFGIGLTVVELAAAGVLTLAVIAAGASLAKWVLTPPPAVVTGPSGGKGPETVPTPVKSPLPAALAARYEPAGEGSDPISRLRAKDSGAFFARVEGGRYQMGGFGPPGDDRPPAPHEEEVPTYFLGETEVTNGQFEAYLNATGTARPPAWDRALKRLIDGLGKAGEKDPAKVAATHPAVGVPHDLAAAYAAWAGGRLPTAAEWEYASRSRGQAGRVFVWDSKSPPVPDTDLAQIDAVSKPGLPTRPVGSFPKDRSDQGIVDLTGNVREWTADRAPRASRPGEPSAYVVRGGSWSSDSARFATTAAESVAEHEALDDLGFRVALDAGPAETD